MNKEFVCICCPLGCKLTVSGEEDNLTVSGYTCKRGKDYAIAEVTAPVRTVTSTVPVSGGKWLRTSVKTDNPIPKKDIFAVIEQIRKAHPCAPVAIGDVIIENVAGTGANIVATRDVEKA